LPDWPRRKPPSALEQKLALFRPRSGSGARDVICGKVSFPLAIESQRAKKLCATIQKTLLTDQREIGLTEDQRVKTIIMRIHPSIKLLLCTVAIGSALAVGSAARAALVTWDLNPSNLNQSLGASSHTFTSNTFSITASGFDNVSGPDTPHTLFFKNDLVDHGLGVDGTPHNELQVGPNGPVQYIQFDLSSILSMGASGGQLKVSSVNSGEAFDIFGSNTSGTLGSKISLGGGPYGDANNDIFVNIPSFGSFKFISVVAAIGDVLPFALRANIPAVPEIGGATAAFVLLAFFGVVMASRAIRTRYNG